MDWCEQLRKDLGSKSEVTWKYSQFISHFEHYFQTICYFYHMIFSAFQFFAKVTLILIFSSLKTFVSKNFKKPKINSISIKFCIFHQGTILIWKIWNPEPSLRHNMKHLWLFYIFSFFFSSVLDILIRLHVW